MPTLKGSTMTSAANDRHLVRQNYARNLSEKLVLQICHSDPIATANNPVAGLHPKTTSTGNDHANDNVRYKYLANISHFVCYQFQR